MNVCMYVCKNYQCWSLLGLAGLTLKFFKIIFQGKPRSGSAPHRRPESTFFKSSSSRRDGEKHGRSGVHVVLPGGSQSDDEDRLR